MVGKHGKNIALSCCFSITFPLPSHCNKVGFILEDSTYPLQLSQLQARHFAALEREIPQAESYPCSVRITLKRVRNSRPSCRTGQIIKRLMRNDANLPSSSTASDRYPVSRSDWCHYLVCAKLLQFLQWFTGSETGRWSGPTDRATASECLGSLFVGASLQKCSEETGSSLKK